MTKFKIVKRFSLDFFGKDWKDAYINFKALSVSDVQEKFPEFTKINEKDEAEVLGGINVVLELLKDKFVSGKGINEKGELVDLEKGDLDELPAELISRALHFLSLGVTTPSLKP